MKTKWKGLVTVCLFVGVLLLGVIVLQGCKESDSGSGTEQGTSGQKWVCSMHPDIIEDRPVKCSRCGMDLVPKDDEKKPGAMMMPMPAKEIAAAAEQTMCPIMGMAIDKKVFVEYKGKKVYFCCPGCEDKFEANPAQYIAKLPQFKD
ncbi:MAG: heavy metal-binding domain-containing protein [Planctomycetota bacterium]|jgi:YHS domain-containing protein